MQNFLNSAFIFSSTIVHKWLKKLVDKAALFSFKLSILPALFLERIANTELNYRFLIVVGN